jgi:hypothetical protein
MRNNVIILAIGLSGSSVLTALIEKAGYSLCGHTVAKPDYDTFENAELVRLNRQLLQLAGATSFGVEYRAQYADNMQRLHGQIDDSEYRAFLEHCGKHQPWVWKDPALSVTMHFWKHLLDVSRIKFIINDREPLQSWISWNIRRQVQSYDYAKRYTRAVLDSMHHLLQQHAAQHLRVRYEDLICGPEHSLKRINAFLGCSLTLDDLARVYHGPLRKKTHGVANFCKASLIYLKNYGERYA